MLCEFQVYSKVIQLSMYILQDSEYNFVCYTVRPCYLSVLYIVM